MKARFCQITQAAEGQKDKKKGDLGAVKLLF